MKILQVVPSLEPQSGGPTYSVSRLASALADVGQEVQLFNIGFDAVELDTRVDHRRFRRDLGWTPLPRSLWPSTALKRAIEKTVADVDVIHAHSMWNMPGVYAAHAARCSGKPLVLSPRGMLSPVALTHSALRKKLFWTLAQKRALATAKLLHATSDDELADLRTFGLRQPIAVIPNGIGIPPEASLGARPGLKRLLFLGRLHPIKGLDLLLEAWRTVSPAHPQWELRLVGPDEGGYRAQLQRLGAGLGLSRISYGGPVYGEAKHEEHRLADAFVLPSLSENFGISVAEALAYGLPVIATHGTPWSGLAERQCGWWVAPQTDALAEAMSEAMSLSPASLRSKGLAGRAWMTHSFAWPRIAQAMVDVYRWAAEGGDPPPTIRFADAAEQPG